MHHGIEFGRALQQWRLARGLTQAALADHVAVSVSLLRKLERGVRRPRPQLVTALTIALGLDAEASALLEALAYPIPGSRSDQHAATPPPLLVPAAPASLPVGWVPASPNRLIGRDADLATLGPLLCDPTTRLLSLVGPPGVGKSRLALALAAAHRAVFPAGTWVVPLAPLAESARLPQALAARIGAQIDAADDPSAALFAYIGPARSLLVLDNCEHLAEAPAFVAALLEACAGLTVLATSRSALRLRAERRWVVAPLVLPASATYVAVQRAPATALLIDRISAVRAAYRPDSDLTALAALARRLDGLPLAIELVAARADALGVPALLASLDAGLDAFTQGPDDLPPHQRTIATTLDWSVAQLPAAARSDLARLAVFAGGWDAPMAAALGATALDSLAAAHLIERRGARFGMLETVRAYGLAQLRATDRLSATCAAHAALMAALTERLAPALSNPERTATVAQLLEETDNLRAAIGWSLSNDGGVIAARLAVALQRFWLDAGLGREARALEPLLLSGTHQLSPALLVEAALAIGFVASQQGAPTALALIELASRTAAQIGDQRNQARALIRLGMLYRLPGLLGRCRRLLDAGLVLAQAAGAPALEIDAHDQIGLACIEAGQPRAALNHFAAAIALLDPGSDAARVRILRCNIAAAHYACGALRAADAAAAAVLAAAHPAERMALGEAACIRGWVAYASGDATTAYRWGEQARAAAEASGISFLLTLALRLEGYAALALHSHATATATLVACARRAADTLHYTELAGALAGLACLATGAAAAAARCAQAEALITALGLPPDQPRDGLLAKARATAGADLAPPLDALVAAVTVEGYPAQPAPRVVAAIRRALAL